MYVCTYVCMYCMYVCMCEGDTLTLLTVSVVHFPCDGILGHRGPEESVDTYIFLRLPL